MNEKNIDLTGNEIAKIIRDSVVEQIPVVGSATVKFFTLQERKRHERIISIFENLLSSLAGIDQSEINWEYVKSEDFNPMLGSVIDRLQYTTAKEKIHRFREILIKDLKTTYYSDFKETYLDLILRLNEDQIKILRAFQKLNVDLGSFSRNESADEKEKERERLKIQRIPKAEDFGLNRDLYLFYIQDLISKSLLYDEGMGRFSTGPFKIIEITQFGLEFLKFIENTDIDDRIDDK